MTTDPATTTESATPVPLLEVRGLVRHHPVRGSAWRPARRRVVHAVCGVSFDLAAGETLAVVGESGSGKSTLARTVLHLQPPTAGSVRFRGRDVATLPAADLRALRREMQIVFQDPYASLDPQMTAAEIVAEPLRIHRVGTRPEQAARVDELLDLVGLDPSDGGRHPSAFSGGQRQRLGIARALALDPALLVLDEPVSALDVSVQAGVVNLLQDLQDRLGLAYLFIAHDLALVRHVATRVAVLHLGHLVEVGPTDAVLRAPAHPYTQALVAATPVPDPVLERQRRRVPLIGELPDPTDPPSGCRFRTRCPRFADELDEGRRERCRTEVPALVDRGDGHPSACHFSGAPAAADGGAADRARGGGGRSPSGGEGGTVRRS